MVERSPPTAKLPNFFRVKRPDIQTPVHRKKLRDHHQPHLQDARDTASAPLGRENSHLKAEPIISRMFVNRSNLYTAGFTAVYLYRI